MLPGIDLDDEGQIKLLQSFSGLYRTEYDSLARDPAPGQPFYLNNYFFMAVDEQAAYCMVRHFRPARVIEVGSGFSTLLLAQALGANAGGNEGRGELTSVDPYPSSVLKRGPEDLTRLIQTPVQQLDPSFFKVLGPNDLLFIDSSHCLSMGSDVQHLYLEVIPRLKPGVLVHIHDIFWPYEYPRQWAHQMRWFFTEQYLLQAFLCGNSSFKVRWSSSHMHAHHPDLLRAAFSSYDCPDCPLLLPPHSFWMQRTD
jgi:predicted O-methyltransferase YrrM